MKPKLEGLEVVYPEGIDEKIEISLKPNEEHVIILRRFANHCKYSTSYMTHNRRFTDEEMMELARNQQQK